MTTFIRLVRTRKAAVLARFVRQPHKKEIEPRKYVYAL